jgi:tyrosyl-tRNA synthetase
MSISDDLMWRYYELLTSRSPDEVSALRKKVWSGDRHPKQLKLELAKSIVTDFHGAAAAEAAETEFETRFARKIITVEGPPIRIAVSPGGISLARLLKELGLAESVSEARRKIEQGGLRIDGVKQTEIALVHVRPPYDRVLQVGRRTVRVQLVAEDPALAEPRSNPPERDTDS